MKRWWIACLCILALGCGGGMSTSAPPAAQKPLPPNATATVDPAGDAIPVSPSFLGLSHEWGEAQDMMGQAPAPLNPAYVQLLRNLDAYGNGPLVLRIGGNSTDRTGEPTPGVVDPFAAVRGATGAEFILGLNFGADDPQLTADQAAAYRAAMPAGSVIAWELGNEPDLYRVNGDRPANYYLPAYIQDFDTWKAKLVPSVLPGPNPFAAPSWAGLSHLVSLQAFLDAEAPSLAMVTQHHYPYSVCGGKTPPTPEMLLSEATIQLAVPSLATYVPEATAVGVPFRLDEVNSVSCLGAYGVSDTFASALWCTDFMCECARLGLSGINIHSHSSGAYSVFTFATSG
ncbi:MAG TPA: hypothetical protein VL181_09090, partial [Holophagaceae bacterium]|nr:hypothetical protein [Holophagaceae bacterium]